MQGVGARLARDQGACGGSLGLIDLITPQPFGESSPGLLRRGLWPHFWKNPSGWESIFIDTRPPGRSIFLFWT